jgi:hypothetical protein
VTRALWLLPALLATACDWERCDRRSAEFALPNPGDAIEIRILACTDRGDGDLRLDMSLFAQGTPTSPLALTVDGIDLHATRPLTWVADSTFSDLSTDQDCSPGKVITLRRLDADPGIAFKGTLTVDMSAPPLRSCSVKITVTEL